MVNFVAAVLERKPEGFFPLLSVNKVFCFFFLNGKFQLVFHLTTVQAFPGKLNESVTLPSFASYVLS